MECLPDGGYIIVGADDHQQPALRQAFANNGWDGFENPHLVSFAGTVKD